MSRDKKFERIGMLKAYNFKCFYCNQLISDPFYDFHLEHIIPEYYKDKESEFNDLKKKKGYVFELKFSEIDTYLNIVPSHISHNLKKGKGLFSRRATKFFLGEAKKQKERVEEEIVKARNNVKENATLITLYQYLSGSEDARDRIKKKIIFFDHKEILEAIENQEIKNIWGKIFVSDDELEILDLLRDYWKKLGETEIQ